MQLLVFQQLFIYVAQISKNGTSQEAGVEGQISPSEGDLIHYLKHDERKTLVSEVSKEDYKLSKLHYKTLKTDKESSKIEICLDSGRYHQIRGTTSLYWASYFRRHQVWRDPILST